MELRKTVKAPKRYEDELEELERPGRTPVRAAPRKSDAYRRQVIDHNPDLPPAAFPTLDTKAPARENYKEPENNHVPPANHKKPHNSISLQHQPHSSSPEQGNDLEPHQLLTASRQKPQLALAAGATQHHMDNGPGNPVWEMNMALLEDLGKRTDEEWFMAEMETSDEGEEPVETRRKTINNSSRPSWESIPSTLRIEMVYAAAGDDNKAETAMIRLELDSTQRQAMTEELHDYQEREAAEDANIAAHQTATTEALLNGGRKYSTQEAFQSLLSAHLYKDLDRQDGVATRREVNDARAYMASCGLDTSFLDSWQPPVASAYTTTESDDEIDAKYPLSVSLREVMGAQNVVTKPVTAHPITSTPQEPLPSLSSVATPIQHVEIQQTSVAQPGEAASPFNEQPVVETRLASRSTSQETTGETIEVNEGSLLTYSRGSAVPSESLSTPQHALVQPNVHPHTPQPPSARYSGLPQIPEPIAIPRSVPWPRTPPTPSHITLPLPDSSGSDYEPKPKKQRQSTSRKQSLQRKTVNQSPAPEVTLGGIVRKKPASSTDNAAQDSGAVPSSQATPISLGSQELESSSAQTDQSKSTIAVQDPGQESTPTAQHDPATGNSSSKGAGTKPKKEKARRGRPRKSQG